MKKCFVWILMVSLLFTCAAAFAEAPVFPEIDLVPPVFEWERDLSSHWQLDENDEIINAGEHTLDDELFCTVCGSEVWDYGDGSGSVSNYDEQVNLLHYTSFENGVVTYDDRHILTYDENGVLALDLEFIDGVFFGEYIYAADEEGNAIPVKESAWYEDGASAVNEYDQYGNCVRSASFEPDGSLSVEIITEYALADDGGFYECRSTTLFASGETFYSEYNQYGDETRSIYAYADGTVWHDVVYEYVYAFGTRLQSRTYENGRLIAESLYDVDGCNVQDTEYLEDGTYIVYTYDENGDTIEAHYDAAGNPVE